jgi:glutathione S-transferase
MRLYRVNFSTNAERVALALAYKGIEVDSRYVPDDDRTEIVEVSAQPLVPVLVTDRDPPQIVAYLDQLAPSPPLYPTDEARFAETLIFIDWFNRVWKLPPNRIAAELQAEEPDHMLITKLARDMSAALDGFESLLSGRKYLMGSELSAADICAFPFLKYALRRDPADAELFHRVLDDYQQLTDDHFKLRSWIKRMDELPRA